MDRNAYSLIPKSILRLRLRCCLSRSFAVDLILIIGCVFLLPSMRLSRSGSLVARTPLSHPEYLEHQAAARAVWQPTFSSPLPLSSSLSPVPSSPCDSSVVLASEVFSGAYLPPSPSRLHRSPSVVVSSVSGEVSGLIAWVFLRFGSSSGLLPSHSALSRPLLMFLD